MRLVEFHATTGSPVSINPDTVCKIGEGFSKGAGTFIRMMDGTTTEVIEAYAEVKKALEK